jgi:hypothetical protein
MNEDQIADIWNLFKPNLDKKLLVVTAEKFVDLLADYGVDDITLKELLGNDKHLDAAINYYLDLDDSYDDEYEDE